MWLRLSLEIVLVLVAAFMFWAADGKSSSERANRVVAVTPEESLPPRRIPMEPVETGEPRTSPPTDEALEESLPGKKVRLPTRREPKFLGNKPKPRCWDPPVNLGHLESTSLRKRIEIDELVDLMIDVDAGRDSLDAKEALIAIGKPAFPRILGAMAKIRDTITDVDSDDERLIESSLKLADECLREMDGWLMAKGKSSLRPGSEKRYIAYICRLHYKRWMKTLKDMPEMPGPYDPSGDYAGEAEEFR